MFVMFLNLCLCNALQGTEYTLNKLGWRMETRGIKIVNKLFNFFVKIKNFQLTL